MKKLLCLIVIIVSLPVLAFASTPDVASLPADELLDLWQRAGERLKEIGAYPYIELSKGDSGTDVTALQARLAELYYYTKDLTGKYDSATEKAVKAWEKAQDIKSDGRMSIDEQDLLYSSSAIPKATPTPSPSPTPAPTPVPASAALAITKVSLKDRYNMKTLALELKNESEHTIDAFSIVFLTYNAYGERTTNLFGKTVTETAEWWKTLTLKPGKKFSMGSYYWMLSDQNVAKVEVAISKYHTTDGLTVEIVEDDLVWFTGEL